MVGSGLSDPPDDGSCRQLMDTLRANADSRLVWDHGGLIKAQYERKLRPQTFGHEWLQEMLLRDKVVLVRRRRLNRAESVRIRETGLVGEDLNYYVRTSAASRDRRLASQDSDYDPATRRALKQVLDVVVLSPSEGTVFLTD